MKEFMIALLIAVAPAALHFRMLLGHTILASVRTGLNPLDYLLRKFPLFLAVIAGMTAMLAYVLWEARFVATLFAIIALVTGILDFVITLISFRKHTENQSQRKESR